MRVLIKKADTDEFYCGNGQWTIKRDEAKTFSNSIDALRECSRKQLKTEIVLSFSDPKADIKIPCRLKEKQ